MAFIKRKILYVEILDTCINICSINNNAIKNYINVPFISSNNENDTLHNQSGLEEILKEYIGKHYLMTYKVILVLSVKAIIRFASYPLIKGSDLSSAIQHSLQEHLIVDLNTYTTDYRIIEYSNNNINVLLIGVKTDILDSYISVFNKLKLRIHTIDLYQNFINMYIASKDKGNIIVVVLQKDIIIMQFIENGILRYIKESNYDDINRLFSVHIEMDGTINIDRVYIPTNVNTKLIDFLVSNNIKIIYNNGLFNLWEDNIFNAGIFWNVARSL